MVIEKNIKNNRPSIINNQLIIVCSCLFALSGCIYDDEPMPKITREYTSKVIRPPVLKPIKTQSNVYGSVPRSWFPPKSREKGWKAIVIHHSGTEGGNATIFDRWHREGNHWEGVGYDFVIGNGTNSGDGEVEVTFRWREQIAGAHVGGTSGNWANKDAIGICLVGDFTKTVPTNRQMQSLVKLIRFLQKQYSIPKSRIYGHRDTPGYTGGSVCPGRNFPMAKLKSMLDF